MGSGFLVSNDGYILTDAHVVDTSKTVKIRWSDGYETTGEVVRLHNADMSSRASKRMHGTIRNLANQLAQIAAGWEASFDGTLLLSEPTKGNYVIDLVRNAATLNGREAKLGMEALLDKWLQGELGRLGRDRDWLSKAMVEVAYELVPSDAEIHVVQDLRHDFSRPVALGDPLHLDEDILGGGGDRIPRLIGPIREAHRRPR